MLLVIELSDNNLERKLVETRSLFKPITIGEVVILAGIKWQIDLGKSNYIQAFCNDAINKQ